LIRELTGDRYTFGSGVLGKVGEITAELGKQAVQVCAVFPGGDQVARSVEEALINAGVAVLGKIEGAGPNAPREDVFRIATELKRLNPDVVVGIGGGSTIDATKSAEVLRTLGGEIDDYFGTGKVTAKLQATGKSLCPVVATQTASSTGSHLTRLALVTDLRSGQKKIIVDDAIVPVRAVFDYDLSRSMPPDFTADGAMDGVAHALEVLLGSVGKPHYDKMMEVAHAAVELVLKYVERAVKNPDDAEARFALGLATDLGGCSLMLGGTSGAHLTSYSLVDVLSHGRACAIMNPYYVVFFAPAVEEPLRMVGNTFREAGLTEAPIDTLSGRELGLSVAEAMIALAKRISLAATLGEIESFTDEHIERALTAAKDPQLRMKLENMPVPLTADMVDEYMAPILQAALEGDLDLIKNV